MASILEKLMDPYIKDEGQIILDVGCGDGRHLVDLSKRYNNLFIGADYSYEIMVKKENFYINHISCDAVYLPLKNSSVDILYSNSFFEHVYDSNAALQEQIRVLKPGGHIFIFVTNILNPKSFFNLFFKYPVKSRLKRGGIQWLLRKRRVEENIYSEQVSFKNIKQRDEDIHSLWWWKIFLNHNLPPNVKIMRLTTGRSDELPIVLRFFLRIFWGGIVVVIEKTY